MQRRVYEKREEKALTSFKQQCAKWGTGRGGEPAMPSVPATRQSKKEKRAQKRKAALARATGLSADKKACR